LIKIVCPIHVESQDSTSKGLRSLNWHVEKMSSSHSSSTSIESFESQFLITCGMCLKDYDEDREPKFLPCAHTFCKLCLTVSKHAWHNLVIFKIIMLFIM
jgi:hypothetical protein